MLKLTFEELSILLNIFAAMVRESDLSVPACLDDEGRKIIKAQLVFEGIPRNRANTIAANLQIANLISTDIV